ncbi:hypothetical protein HYT56_03945 [Candidatus Woesearchaeota archaeon]|nr:hypothetical protein [Candidatus Woesearchaeota archaeon]
MGFIDWVLSRSRDFSSLSKQVKTHKNIIDKHKKNTVSSFQRVKRDNILIAKKLKQHEDGILKLHSVLNDIMSEASEPMRVYKKKNKPR